MTLRIAPGSDDATIAMAIVERIELREIEIFICGLSNAREAKGGQRVKHLSKLTVCGGLWISSDRVSEPPFDILIFSGYMLKIRDISA